MSRPAFAAGPVHVRVPATSANLGPGFDALGLALALHDDVTAEVVDAGLVLEINGEGSADVARDESHLVVSSMYRTFDLLGGRPGGLIVHCRNRIPHSRGLGSSAAAIVAGVLLARALIRDGGRRLDDDAALGFAAAIEGHPDNVAPCLLGGLTIAWSTSTSPPSSPSSPSSRAVRLDVNPGIRPLALIPNFTASTEAARGLLPATVTHADAAHAAGRAALLIAGLTRTPGVLFDATEDRLHQSYRAPAMPVSLELLTALRGAGLPAVVSGAGPTVLVLARDQLEVEQTESRMPVGWTMRELAVEAAGANIVT